MGEFIFIVIIIYILYKIFGGGKKEKPNKNYDPDDYTKQPSPDDGYDNMDDYINDIPSTIRRLVEDYNKAYDEKNEDDLEINAAYLISAHFVAIDNKKTDIAVILENTASKRPYKYYSPWIHSLSIPHINEIEIKKPTDLLEIFREQNYLIELGRDKYNEYLNNKEKRAKEKNDNQNKKDVKTSNENQSQKKKGVVATDFENNDNSFTHEEFDDYINGAIKTLPQTTKNIIASYKKAYDACNEKKLEEIVEDMIKLHNAAVSIHKTTERELLEKAVEARPYKYRGKNKKGEDLFTLFWKQNKEVEKRDGYI